MLAFVMLAVAGSSALAQARAGVRLRGTVEALSPTTLVLRQRNGDRVELAIASNLGVTEVYPVQLADIQAGSFVGVGAIPQADGSQKAIAVTLFPESMRGTGEGHRPFDFVPQGTMTNATVADVAATPDGEHLRLRYPGGEQLIVVAPGTPIVSFHPGDRSLLTVGSAVSLTAQEIAGQPTVTRISAGRNGFAPPY
ncbi:hypothetical protein [Ramlibacter ginsenosidimutans]|nr:hypothetical protein [Ramlibacter ginsenosidimutans]